MEQVNFYESLVHRGMNQDASNSCKSDSEQNEHQDEKGRLLTRLFCWPGDAKGVDEGIGKKVEKLHG